MRMKNELEQGPAQSMRVCIIVPAHNEAAVIGRFLKPLEAQITAGEARVIVVANGCRDQTAKVARDIPGVEVIETDIGSKSNALNLGDEAAGNDFPRFYVDADVKMNWDVIRAVADFLIQNDALAAAPAARFDTTNSSWGVKRFYSVWLSLPYLQSGMIGSGVYALSAAGRARFDGFPAIIADDAFVRLHFKAGERAIVPNAHFTVTAPRDLWSLIRIKTRSHLGNVELKMKYPHLTANEEARHGKGLRSLALAPSWWPALGVYGFVKLVTRYRAAKQVRAGRFDHWERDETSRVSVQ
jgi:glycosyltransferase involved in cell wall biosynthesis